MVDISIILIPLFLLNLETSVHFVLKVYSNLNDAKVIEATVEAE